jgi:presenilin 1
MESIVEPNLFLEIDLIAVLCPFGPLRLLIESSRTQQREVPALLYSVNAVWFMLASPNHFHISHSFTPPTNDDGTRLEHPPLPPDAQLTYHMNPAAITTTTSLQSVDSVEHRYPASTASSSAPLHQRRHSESRQSTIIPTTHRSSILSTADAANIDCEAMVMEVGHIDTDESRQRIGDHPTTVMDEEDSKSKKEKPRAHDTDVFFFFFLLHTAERSGLKLGLGDFVFYSVLVARAGNPLSSFVRVCCVYTHLFAVISHV